MPIYRYRCGECGSTSERLVNYNVRNPLCCGQPTSKLMPNRVSGIVKSESTRAMETREQLLAEAPPPPSYVKERDPEDPLTPKTPKFVKDYADCSAAERDSRWAETKEAMTQWQTDCLTLDGMDYSKAKAKAKAYQDEAIPKARAGIQREDGLS